MAAPPQALAPSLYSYTCAIEATRPAPGRARGGRVQDLQQDARGGRRARRGSWASPACRARDQPGRPVGDGGRRDVAMRARPLRDPVYIYKPLLVTLAKEPSASTSARRDAAARPARPRAGASSTRRAAARCCARPSSRRPTRPACPAAGTAAARRNIREGKPRNGGDTRGGDRADEHTPRSASQAEPMTAPPSVRCRARSRTRSISQRDRDGHRSALQPARPRHLLVRATTTQSAGPSRRSTTLAQPTGYHRSVRSVSRPR